MPGSSPPRDNIKGLLTKINGAGLPSAYWDEGRPMNPKGWIELTEISCVSQGTDEYRREYDPATKTQSMILAGVRKWVLQVKVYSYMPALKALDVIEKIKLRLGKPYAFYQYSQWGLALQDWGTTIVMPNIVDGHVHNSATCDFTWGWRITDLDLETDSEGFIDEAAGEGTIAPKPNVIDFDIKGS